MGGARSLAGSDVDVDGPRTNWSLAVREQQKKGTMATAKAGVACSTAGGSEYERLSVWALNADAELVE